MITEADQETNNPPRRWPLLAILAGVVFLWAASGYIVSKIHQDQAERGQFGDQFGAVNALFSGLAFGCVVYAIFLQHRALELQQRELALQRQELRLQREELKLTREEFAEQSKIMAQQLDFQKQQRSPQLVPQGRSVVKDDVEEFRFVNIGARPLEVKFKSFEAEGEVRELSGDRYAVDISPRRNKPLVEVFDFWLFYVRTDGESDSQRFRVINHQATPIPHPDEEPPY